MSDNNDEIVEQNKEENDDSSMSFFEHIEELRKRIIYALIGVIISCAGAGIFINDLMQNIFLKPALDANLSLQNLQPFGQPFLYFKVIATSGLIISMPFMLYQFWLFISPALYENEKKWIRAATLFTSLCFFIGVLFSYFILVPSMLGFAASFGSELIENKIDVNAYFGFISLILLASGIMFELPMLSYILSKMELITSKLLSKYRKHSIIVILIIAAVLTPTPDPISQLIFAAPICVLYEISVFISFVVNKKKKEGVE
jgi:sec-independent protein translocase protein TatC